MKLEIENKIKWVAFGTLLVLIFLALYFFVNRKETEMALLDEKSGYSSNDQENLSKFVIPDKSLVVTTDEVTEKIDLSTGKVELANLLDQRVFIDYQGFPLLGNNKKEIIEQSFVLVSQDEHQALVAVTTYGAASSGSESEILSTDEYLCDIGEKKCLSSDLLAIETYQGINAELQKKYSAPVWVDWDSQRNLIFGNLISENFDDNSLVYVCNTQKKVCRETESFDSSEMDDVRIAIPAGAFSSTLEKFVTIRQYDEQNKDNEKRTDLLLYSSDEPSQPKKIYNITEAIRQDENFGYDNVNSVDWSKDDKRLALATNSRIFVFDFETEKLLLAYVDPAVEDGDISLDSSSLFLSPDGRYIAFIDFVDIDEETEDETYNVLKRIDLENNNEITELVGDYGLSIRS